MAHDTRPVLSPASSETTSLMGWARLIMDGPDYLSTEAKAKSVYPIRITGIHIAVDDTLLPVNQTVALRVVNAHRPKGNTGKAIVAAGLSPADAYERAKGKAEREYGSHIAPDSLLYAATGMTNTYSTDYPVGRDSGLCYYAVIYITFTLN